MSDFFNSDIIQEEIKEIGDIQDQIYGSILTFGMMNRETKIEYIEKLNALLQKQRIMYTRLSLSDDPEALDMKENMKKSVSLMGFPPETDMQVLFMSVDKTIAALRNYVDS